VDLLLFGNQISKPVRIKEIVKTIRELVESKEVDISVIELANERVEKLKRGIK
jgi:hypothetical protein